MNPSESAPPPTMDRQQVRQVFTQIWRITRAFFNSERRARARGLSFLLLALSVASSGLGVLTNHLTGSYITALSKKWSHGFWMSLGWYLGALALVVLVNVYTRWAQDSLALLWREWMSQRLIKRYFNNRAYYRLRGSENIDNPDQRIAEDVRNFATDSLSYVLTLVGSITTLFMMLGVLWTISGKLVGMAVIYAAFGTWMCFKIGRRLVAMHFHRYQKEADLRYGLVRVRDNAESIAFYRGEKREHLDLVRRLAAVVTNLKSIILWNRRLGFFRNSFDQVALLLPIVITGPMYMHSEIELGKVTQSIDAFAQVLGSLTIISTQFEGLSSYLAGIRRLTGLWRELDEFDADEVRVAREAQEHLDETSGVVKLEHLNVITPDASKMLARDLSFELETHHSLIIMGASGTGKSSVLRTIAGLWPSGGGDIERPALPHLMFLPQRPYMVPGSLRDQLRYPFSDRTMDERDMRGVMESVRLEEVLARVDGNLDAVIDWGTVLSLGEQQRVAFARVFLRRPQFVFLDEATSALDEENQEHLYRLIQKSDIGFISVGHRLTLVPFHQRMLQLRKDGSWEITDVKQA